MHSYGEMFRILRKERGFTLKTMSENIVSYSYLSKFEKGESDITLTNLNQMLSRMNIGLDEFIGFQDEFTLNYSPLLKKVGIAYSQNKKDLLVKYYNEEILEYEHSQNKFNKLNAIMIAALLQDIKPDFKISQNDINFYIDYIFKCTYWSMYEIILFGNALRLFNHETILLLLGEIKNKIKNTDMLKRNAIDLISVLMNASLVLLRRGYIEETKEISEFMNKYLLPNNYYEKTRMLFIDGLVLIHEGNTKDGEVKAREAIKIIELLNKEMVPDYENELKNVLNEVK